MTYNGAKTTQTLADELSVNTTPSRRCEESLCREMAHNGSKRHLEPMPGTCNKAGQLAGSRHREEGTPDITPVDSRHSESTPVVAGQVPDGEARNDSALLAIAEPARKQKRLDPDEMRRLIRSLCQDRFLSFRQLATLLSREPNGLQRWTLRPMAQERQLVMAFPDTPNHPKQAYKTNPERSAE